MVFDSQDGWWVLYLFSPALTYLLIDSPSETDDMLFKLGFLTHLRGSSVVDGVGYSKAEPVLVYSGFMRGFFTSSALGKEGRRKRKGKGLGRYKSYDISFCFDTSERIDIQY